MFMEFFTVCRRFSSRMRRAVLLSLYAAQLIASLWVAYELRFDFSVGPQYQLERLCVLLWLIPLQLACLARFGQFKPLLGYFSTPDLARVVCALTVALGISWIIWTAFGAGVAPPRGVIVVDFVIAVVGLTGARLALRTLREYLETTDAAPKTASARRRVAIIGAGDAGAILAQQMIQKPNYGLEPVAFFDDNRDKWNSRVHGIPVLGPAEKLPEFHAQFGFHEAIIAMPSAAAKRVGDIVRLLRETGLPCKTVPSLDQLAWGQVRVSQLRPVEVQDLLGRERVELETETIREALRGKVVLVTGAGGSIGSELCRQIASYQPAQLLLLERSEPNLFKIEQELIGLGHGSRTLSVLGDIGDAPRLRQIFATHRPHVVFHAAAHKHVPMMEYQPGEAIKNNSIGTALTAEVAAQFGVERFILISSDKAICPSSVMGATKRLAEMFIQSLNAANRTGTKFMAVRFGNVLGSSGSVIPLFEKQIAEGGPVRVTHPEMTRFFMTIPEASMLVLQSAIQGEGGEIFVLDMGKSVKIVDLARQMIELSGLKPDEDIQIQFVGMRPGEKLFEEITHKGENIAPTTHPKIFRFISQPLALAAVRQVLTQLRERLHDATPDDLKLLLKGIVPDYEPHLTTTGKQPGGRPAREVPAAEHAPAPPALGMRTAPSQAPQVAA